MPTKKATKTKAAKADEAGIAKKAGISRKTSAESANGRALVVVESPAKAKTLQKYLGSNYKIEASVGHVIDLPDRKLGVDVEHGFKPEYHVLRGKQKVVEKICRSAASASRIYLAPDPDREGEAIAWHLADALQKYGVTAPVHRAKFNEITKKAVQQAIEHPQELNANLFEAQQARRILDRLVGYQVSPLLWKKVMRGLSAGRVQSVAVRLVADREREIDAFIPQEYWSVLAQVEADAPPAFEMKLAQLNGQKPELATTEQVRQVLSDLGLSHIDEQEAEPTNQGGDTVRKRLVATAQQEWTVTLVDKKDVRRRAAPPFITSTLQQEAARKLGFSASKTMTLAQKLYEGVELREEGMTALITYMRTDSTRLSGEAIGQVRPYIASRYGDQYVPESPNFFKSRKSAQEAHEAIRPVDMQYAPERVAGSIERDMLRLYTLIWNRFVACQMADAIFEQTKVEARPRENILFSATGLVPKFNGYLAVYEEGRDDVDSEDAEGKLPSLVAGDRLRVLQLTGRQHFTQPPPRFTEASLVKELERLGIGRPSTYASIVSVIQDKEYVSKDDQKRFRPTQLGYVVTDLLVENFPEILDAGFTAQMEEQLDEVEEGQRDWQNLLSEFYGGFKERLDAAAKHMRAVKAEATPTDIPCDKCGEANMVIKWGRMGRFLACPRYPDCKNTMNFKEAADGGTEITPERVEESEEMCEGCGSRLVYKTGRFGRFLACPNYPECKTVSAVKTGVKCPQCKEGDLVEKTTRRGKMFFSCARYPECQYAVWHRPIPQPCPKCGSDFLLLREGKKRMLTCPNEKCDFSEPVAPPSDEQPAPEQRERLAG